jgi:hypothetical protein
MLLAGNGTRRVKGVLDVEYHRDVRPIFDRSCIACHSHKAEKPAGGLVLDDDRPVEGPRWDLGNAGKLPATYNKLAGHYLGVAKYVTGFQSRRSLLVWKVFGKRLDGLPKEPLKGREREHAQIVARGDFTGSVMPPPEAVKAGKAKALSDEDKRTLVRWIDLGCPVDKAFDPEKPAERGDGWMLDDQRPTLALTHPRAGANGPLTRILVGMHDYGTGLDESSFRATADFPLGGAKPGEDLSGRFKEKGDGVREWTLPAPVKDLKRGTLTVSVKDRQGNESRIVRTFSVKAE